MEKENASNRIDLLNGSIAGALFSLSLPIMGTQFIVSLEITDFNGCITSKNRIYKKFP